MPYDTLALFLVRLLVGGLFIYHGWEKVRDMKKFKAPGGRLVSFLVAYGEFLGGIGIVLGVLSRMAALGLAIIMVGTIPFMFKWKKPFITTSTQCGWDYNLLLLLGVVIILLMGSGTWVLLF